MIPVDFPFSNATIGEDLETPYGTFISGRCKQGIDDAGRAYFITAWQPNQDDLQALNSGKPVYLKIFSREFPPNSLFTINDEGIANTI